MAARHSGQPFRDRGTRGSTRAEGACPISARKELPREYLRFSTAPNPPHAALRGLPSTKLLLQQDALHDRPGTAGAAPPGCVSTRRRPLRGGPSTHTSERPGIGKRQSDKLGLLLSRPPSTSYTYY